MECVWDAGLLQRAAELPPELLETIQHGSNEQYLSSITKASLDSRYTYLILAHCEDIYAHVCASLRYHGSFASAVATLGRIVPVAPCLKPYAHQLLSSEQYAFSPSRDSEEDLLYLLGLFRLLSSDWRAFKSFIKPSTISQLLESPSKPVVYLAIRMLQIYLSGADHWFQQMVKRYLGQDSPENRIEGRWDDRIIDYRFLTLWEEDRLSSVNQLVKDVRSGFVEGDRRSNRVLSSDCFHPSCSLVGGTLVPRSSSSEGVGPASDVRLVQTSTIQKNLCSVAAALKSPQPLMLTGLAGSGKTLLARHLAQKLGALDNMITLHLNEQSDAKLLIGIYTTGDTPGSFVWRPGVLTQAVQEGRWVLIEDLDRAPNEIIGTLLPLIEKRELMIANRKQTLHAAPGFRILATTRSTINHRGEKTSPLAHMLGARHWQMLEINAPETNELRDIANQLYPALAMLMPQMITVFERLHAFRQRAMLVGQSRTGVLRAISPRDFLKWCGRVASLLHDASSFTSQDVDSIFLEAIDSFVGALPGSSARNDMAAVIAQEFGVDPQRRDYLLTDRDVKYDVNKSAISVGRYSLPRFQATRKTNINQDTFSTNPHTCRMLERVAAAVLNREPLLLVGETGVGKTTAVQHLANHLGKKLVPFNLSQQSEAGDLLGGFKPVNPRSIIIPLKDEFDELFSAGFSRSKNQEFLDLLGKQMSRSNWKAVCKLWRQALKMADDQRSDSVARQGSGPSKKRKVESKKTLDLTRWDAFAAKLSDLERRLATGSNAFAFSFVEGTIVKAVRNGDWVLLDEINLASPDTLESIADLFDASNPSVLLTESGSVERVTAHPDFRIFAAMNPATDVGKKDLPPGVRSRFTELYVESPDKDIKSLQSIVRSYLRHEAGSDSAIPTDVSTLYQNIIGLAERNQLVDGAGQRPHFSLRTLTRTLSYANYIAPLCSLRRALYEGFHMSFLTFLDVESCRLVEPLLEQYIFGKRTNVRAELSRSLRTPSDGFKYVQGYPGSKHWIRQGAFAVEEQPQYILTPFIRRNLENLVRASSTRRFPVLIQGPTSSGKTSMIEYLAKRSGHKFVRINNHEHTDLQEYLGTYVSGADGRLQFQEGVLVKALREGHWIVLDELNLAPTDVLEALNRLLDDNRELLVPETQEVVRPHENFMLFATQNPAGLYGGRKTLSRAFRNRFLELHFGDIPIDELQEILQKRTQLPESRCKRVVSVYRELSVLRQESRMFEQRSFATLRDLFRWALRPNDTIESLAANGFMLLGERVRKPEERQTLKEVIERVMSTNGPRVRIDEDALYSESSPEITQYHQRGSDQGVVWTKAMRRLYCLVSRAIQNNEPVLLVGDTGCGKTTVCQMLAGAFGKSLHTVNAHQNTETGDIIGSQRPVRNRAVIEASLRHQLLSSSLLQSLDTAAAHSTDALLDAYGRAVASLGAAEKQSHIPTQEHAEIQLQRTRLKALFEWADGSLVQAMKEGSFFLLDEISLADDSVLERINSVLESQRSILLAEKGSLDSYVTAAPDFQFFATMNPGGDYGKRELSPALRNRFTEIWVPPLSDIEDVTQIVQHKLTESAKPNTAAIVAFAQWFNEQYNTSASSSISIRDTLAWVGFINAFANEDAGAAIVHGAAMVYVDTLGANPAGLMTMNTAGLDHERARCIEKTGQLLGSDATAIYSAPIDVEVNSNGLRTGPFNLRSHSMDAASGSMFSFEPPTTRVNAMRVVRAMQLPKPVLLEGSPGVGKTALVTAIANAVGMPLTRINLSEQTDLLDLFGSDVPVEGSATGSFAWRDAPFLRAMKNGEWVLLDEMNLASQSVLEGLNACLDHRGEVFVPELGQTFIRHPEFRLFAAQNPHHQGGGRKGLPASFVNRFTVVFADAFRSEDLVLISRRLYPDIDVGDIRNAVSFVEQLDREVVQSRRIGTNGGPWEFNLRDVSRWLSLASADQGLLRSATARDFVDLLFSQRFRSETDRAFVADLFARHFDSTETPSDLFPGMSTQLVQIGLGILQRNASFAPPKPLSPSPAVGASTNLATIQSVMLCLQQNWPVILTGAPGVGKTALIDQLATAVGAEVTTIAMNADSDAMDLIGGFDQADPQRQLMHIRTQIRTALSMHLKDSLAHRHSPELVAVLESDDENALLAALPELQTQGLLSIEQVSEMQATLQRASDNDQTIDKARFEWIDGLLVDALQEGKWLVLENANLCNPSVLDRLNSLLEPGGSLIINEHTTEDGAARIVRPHPDFRIFLTYDPRYGELSRAMRNRAVELHLPKHDTDRTGGLAEALHPESAMARTRRAQLIALEKTSDASSTELLRTMTDHSQMPDVPLIQRFIDQLKAGLYGLPGSSVGQLDQIWSTASHAAMQSVAAVYKLSAPAVGQAQVSADLANIQTFHPLSNQALARNSPASLSRAHLIAFVFEVFTQASVLSAMIESIRSNGAQHAALRRLERSYGKLAKQTSGGGKSSIILESFSNALQSLVDWSQSVALAPPEVLPVRRIITALFGIWFALLQYLGSGALDTTTLFSYMASLAKLLNARGANAPSAVQEMLSQICQTPLSILGDSAAVEQSMSTALWRSFRPVIPTTRAQLDGLLHLETLADQFDRRCRSYELSLDTMADMRISFTRALVLAALGQQNIAQLSSRLQEVMSEYPEETLPPEAEDGAHFASNFRHVLEKLALFNLGVGGRMHESELAKLEILASQKMNGGILKTSMLSDQPIETHLQLLQIIVDPLIQQHSDSTFNIRPLTEQLRSMKDVSLGRMRLLGEEVQILGRLVSSQAHTLSVDDVRLLDAPMRAFAVQLQPALATDAVSVDHRQLVDQLLIQPSVPSNGAGRSHDGTSNLGVRKADDRIHAALSRLGRASSYLTQLPNIDNANIKQMVEAWASLAVSCLELYTPSTPFDPALDVRFEQNAHRTTREHLVSQLEAFKAFRDTLTAQPDTLRLRMLEEDIITLGDGPSSGDAYRPAVSRFLDMKTELDSLMRVIRPLIQSVGPLADQFPLDDSTMMNIVRVRSRLATEYREYDDFARPAVGFIDWLLVAQTLATKSLASDDAGSLTPYTESLVPLAGATWKTWSSDDMFVSAASGVRTLRDRLYWLNLVAVRSSLLPASNASPELQNATERMFHQMYVQWRTELQRGQKQNAAKSSLYKYKGLDEQQDEPSLEELDELFPGDATPSAATSADSSGPKAQDEAPDVAQLHSRLFGTNDTAATPSILDAPARWLRDAPEPSNSGFDQHRLPALVRSLRVQNDQLSGQVSGHKHNIYKDPNPAQAKVLVGVINLAVGRFRSLHETFAEHATPVEVLRQSDEILQIPHSTPLAQLLPRVEKLHGAVNQWQAIASRQYNVLDILERLTNLVVSWRQLELSSWAGLFDNEWRQSQEAAASWWYIAYENIMLSNAETDGPADGQAVLQELLQALGDFMASSGLGEYSARLDILRAFEAHLWTRSKSDEHFGKRYSALRNFNAFYSRFTAKVEETLANGRRDLEKEVKNVIQVASWKDRNIDTLRQSAQSSHRKLLRLVRKFRTLLAQPVAQILTADLPAGPKIEAHQPPAQKHIESAVVSYTEVDVPQLSVWISRPQRFRNVEATARTINNKLEHAFQDFDFASRLSDFTTDLQASIKELQKATPSVLTDENKAVVKNLKTRKRRVLADVLRDLRTLGFQSTVSDDVLARQRNTSVVLARLPALRASDAFPNLPSVEHAFHQFIAIVPAARESARKPSDDLTPAEASRCLFLLESVLEASMSQHHALALATSHFEQMAVPLKELRNFGQSMGVNVVAEASTLDDGLPHASMFTSVLGATRTILQDQGTLSGVDYQDTLQEIQDRESQLSQLIADGRESPGLPAGLQADHLTDVFSRIDGTLREVVASVRQAIKAHPEVQPVLSHVEPWVDRHDMSTRSTNGYATSSAGHWVQKTLGVLDTMLVAVQNAEQMSTDSRRDEARSHFPKQHSLYKDVTGLLQMKRLAEELATLSRELAHLDHDEKVSLEILASIIRTVTPIFDAYQQRIVHLLSAGCEWYGQLSQAGHVLATSFIQLCERGFCTPSEKSQDSSNQKGDVEAGTGLGEGEGAEDISKDIGDDEDISELAQSKADEAKSELEDEKDAVDMADEEFEGELGDGPKKTEGDGGEGEEDGEEASDIDEEAANEDIGPDAVDEKMWDEGGVDGRNEKDADSGKGKAADEENTAGTEQEQDRQTPDQDGDLAETGEPEAAPEEDAIPEHEAADQLDPQAGEEQNLELPDDLTMDGNRNAEPDDSDLESVGTDDGQDGRPDNEPEDQVEEAKEDEETLEGETDDIAEESHFAQDSTEEQAPEGQDDDQDTLMQDQDQPNTEPQDETVAGAEEGTGGEKAETSKQQPGATQDSETAQDEPSETAEEATGAGAGRQQGPQDNNNDTTEDAAGNQLRSSFKRLGDILEEWYDQHRDIEAARPSDERRETEQKAGSGSRFEHLPDEGTEADAQALGSAPMDQSAPIDRDNAVSMDEGETGAQDIDQIFDESKEEIDQDMQDTVEDRAPDGHASEAGQSTSLVGEPKQADTDAVMAEDMPVEDNDEVEDVDEQLTNTHISQEEVDTQMTLDDAQQLWAKHEDNTRNLALMLTEHLRLILHPTQATRMRGDFRTGKRLNIKRIIPYIASSYKRDKIWMRRSVPTKRSYQVMLAIDDSKSMAENSSHELAFETLALIAKSMSMLEVGELSVVGFGDQVNVAHDFSTPFTTDAGSRILQQFTFSQSRTNVQRLLTESIEHFRAARLKAAGSASDLWQLQLIISDGICEDHPAIRQLIRQAHEERIMVVFIVVDPAALSSNAANGAKQSILDLQTAEFAKDASGEMQLKMTKYLDTFPFRYYLIVRDVQDLPGVLAGALRQWFAETVDASG
ncbi:AAA ATPase midasin [Saxophila tyrrhenica]|uniref:Midasin n=1 Tax=Saxophila tyrrhenica TaxID=1690608 RepID=A0AAV9PL66_9PEZI|nr:AAA ATPase midasin [Saxophila tyrrhenica]